MTRRTTLTTLAAVFCCSCTPPTCDFCSATHTTKWYWHSRLIIRACHDHFDQAEAAYFAFATVADELNNKPLPSVEPKWRPSPTAIKSTLPPVTCP